MINVLIVVPEITKGMKSIGSKALLVIKNPITILDYQIKQIKKCIDTDTNIIIATGFESEKIKKNISEKYKDIQFLYNDKYRTTNQSECLSLYTKKYSLENLFVIGNGIIFKDMNFDLNKQDSSKIFLIDKPKSNFTIGCSDLEDINYLFYDLPILWSECFYLDKVALQTLVSISKTENIAQLYLFELINKLILNKIIFEKKIIRKKNIMKIINNKDISKAKQFI